MAQGEVLGYLRYNRPNWFNASQIAQALGANRDNISTNLRKLHYSKFINRRFGRGPDKRNMHIYYFSFKE